MLTFLSQLQIFSGKYLQTTKLMRCVGLALVYQHYLASSEGCLGFSPRLMDQDDQHFLSDHRQGGFTHYAKYTWMSSNIISCKT